MLFLILLTLPIRVQGRASQVVVSKRLAKSEGMGKITNVVFMGMGEPLHNADAVINAVDILCEPRGMALSHNR